MREVPTPETVEMRVMNLLREHSMHSQMFAVCAFALENTISLTEEETDAFNTLEVEEEIVLMA